MTSRRDRDIMPRFPSVFSSLQNFPGWDEMTDKMTQWMGGANRGLTMSEDENRIYIEADLPGLKDEDINISLHQNMLVIQGEKKEEETDKEKRFHRRAQRSYYYEVELPSNIQEDTEQVEFVGGVLRLSFDKTTHTNVKKIQIKRTGSQSETNQRKNNG